MEENAQVEHLVDEITKRVQARMGQMGRDVDSSSSIPKLCQDMGVKASSCDECKGCHVHRADDVRNFVKLGVSRIAAGTGHERPASDLAQYIDHTLLKGDTTRDELKTLCDEARKYQFATVCVNACNVRYCAALLEGSSTKAIAVVGFPLGAETPAAKAFEAREAVRNGAAEIDMVINIGALKDKDYSTVLNDIISVVQASAPTPVKVILENGLLNYEQKVIACTLSKIANAAFVKTSTGFGHGGATVEDITLMRDIVGPEMGVKASGGVRSEADALKMLDAGATRIGASASIEIVMGKMQGKSKSKAISGGY